MVCIDTNVVIDFLKGRKSVTEKIFSLNNEGCDFAVSPITVYEVLFGSWFYNSKEIPKVEQFFDSVNVLDFNYECASVASVIHSSSMRSGRDIGIMDSLIAATARISRIFTDLFFIPVTFDSIPKVSGSSTLMVLLT